MVSTYLKQIGDQYHCGSCKEYKDAASFPPARFKTNGGRVQCRQCNQAKGKEHYAKHGRKKNYDRDRAWQLKKIYGITTEDYNSMLAAQGGRCATCGSLPDKRALDVDHCHTTGKVRGLLCAHCNTTLGKVRDDPKILQSMIDYLTVKR